MSTFEFLELVNMLLYMAKRNLQNVIKLKVLRWGDYFGLSGWTQCKHRVLIREKEESRVREAVMTLHCWLEEGSTGQGMQAASRGW